jgi:hypothetical protein
MVLLQRLQQAENTRLQAENTRLQAEVTRLQERVAKLAAAQMSDD